MKIIRGKRDKSELWSRTPNIWGSNIGIAGVFNCRKAVLPLMIAQGGGRIVNLSAVDGATQRT